MEVSKSFQKHVGKAFLMLLAFALLGLAACTKKELPQPVEETPQIWVKAKIDGVPVEMAAGEGVSYATTIKHNIDSNLTEFVFKINALDNEHGLQITFIDSFNNFGTIEEQLAHSITTGGYKFAYTSSWPFKLNANEIIVIYNDYRHSEEYYSLYSPQPQWAKFEIQSVKDVIFEGKPFRMAQVAFSCKIRDPFTGWTYTITDGTASIPFGQR
ncbi:MAG: hypothetical protein F9K23_02220 [Bacteroidetes bacterium]|nr:MAG: hypothetical protein F9K23_02220 [Bacteroidota bacterium]